MSEMISEVIKAELNIAEMLTHGLHLGHLSRFWNPKMAPYIHKIRYGVHIINLVKTERCFSRALSFVEKIVSKGGRILFVGTKARASDLIAQHADRCGMPYVNHRWLGGMLTNFKTVKQSISRLTKLQEMSEQGTLDKLTKKEALMKRREIDKLEKTLGGIKKLNRLPDALFVVDVGYEDIAVKEANKLGIPVIGLVDTNNSPDGIQYIIPANDDAILSINYSLSLVANLIERIRSTQAEQNKSEAKQLAREPQTAPVKRAPKENLKKESAPKSATVEIAVAPAAVENLAATAAATISAADVKKLRDLTEAAMMDCKKALVQAEGDFEKAKEILMQTSQKKVAKSASRVAAEGVIHLIQKDDYVGIVEVNCETDFVARDQSFMSLQGLIEKALGEKPAASMEDLLELVVDGGSLKDHIAALTAKLGEKLEIRRVHFEKRDGQKLGVYNHGGKIASYARINIEHETLARDLAMHIAAMNPLYLDLKSIPEDVLKAQEAVVIEELVAEGEKTEKIKKTIIKGRLEKYFGAQCLMTQQFIKQSDLTIADLLKANSLKLVSYGRFEVGEGIEKQHVDFAEEVMAQARKS